MGICAKGESWFDMFYNAAESIAVVQGQSEQFGRDWSRLLSTVDPHEFFVSYDELCDLAWCILQEAHGAGLYDIIPDARFVYESLTSPETLEQLHLSLLKRGLEGGNSEDFIAAMRPYANRLDGRAGGIFGELLRGRDDKLRSEKADSSESERH